MNVSHGSCESCQSSVQPGMWTVTVDLSDAYYLVGNILDNIYYIGWILGNIYCYVLSQDTSEVQEILQIYHRVQSTSKGPDLWFQEFFTRLMKRIRSSSQSQPMTSSRHHGVFTCLMKILCKTGNSDFVIVINNMKYYYGLGGFDSISVWLL